MCLVILGLMQMSILRDIKRAKTLLKAVGSITQSRLRPGDVVVKQGDLGESMYTVVKVGGLFWQAMRFIVRSPGARCASSPCRILVWSL